MPNRSVLRPGRQSADLKNDQADTNLKRSGSTGDIVGQRNCQEIND